MQPLRIPRLRDRHPQVLTPNCSGLVSSSVTTSHERPKTVVAVACWSRGDARRSAGQPGPARLLAWLFAGPIDGTVWAGAGHVK